MVALKGQDIDRTVARPPGSCGFFLVYGPDSGLAAERAQKIATALADPADPFSLIRMEAADVASDPNRLPDEAYAVSMFGGRRSILVRDAGSRPSLVGIVTALLKSPPPETTIVLEAGDLKRSHGLRTLFERDRTALALPCYADDDAAIGRLVDEELRQAKLTIAPDARALLIGHLGGDRLISRGEVQKLCLYCHGRDRVERADVEDLVGDSSAVAADEIVDAAAVGDLATLTDRLLRAEADGLEPERIAQTALRHFQQLDDWRGQVEAGRRPADIVEAHKPPVHFSRRARAATALGLWAGPRVERALTLIMDTIRDARLNAPLSRQIVGDCLITIARVAASASRGRR